jgi:hypothetical protein
MHRKTLTFALTLALLLTAVSAASAQTTYRISFTNVTYNQIVSPPIVATHNFALRLFNAGRPASDALAALAEDADAAGLLALLEGSDLVHDFAIADAPLLPGKTVTLTIESEQGFDRLSALGMLVSTNDTFFGLSNFSLEGGNRVRNVSTPAYDAGSEMNNELCDFIPGPPCGNPFQRATPGEGFVHIHRGIHGIGDLPADAWDWRNPVVRMTVIRE